MIDDDRREPRVTLGALTFKTVVAHTLTYFVAGALAYNLGDYETTFSQPPLSYFMRPTSDPWIMAGPLLQPVRGVIFALAFYPLRDVLFRERDGWMILWWLLIALGVLSTFGPAPGSVEGLIYTIVPPLRQLLGLWEVLLQSLLFSALLVYWVRHPGTRWLTWTLAIVFTILMLLLAAGLAVRSIETSSVAGPRDGQHVGLCEARDDRRTWPGVTPGLQSSALALI
jgi:hypothetical protein